MSPVQGKSNEKVRSSQRKTRPQDMAGTFHRSMRDGDMCLQAPPPVAVVPADDQLVNDIFWPAFAIDQPISIARHAKPGMLQ